MYGIEFSVRSRRSTSARAALLNVAVLIAAVLNVAVLIVGVVAPLAGCRAARRDNEVRIGFVDPPRKTSEELNAESERIHDAAIERAIRKSRDREREEESESESEPQPASTSAETLEEQRADR